MSVEFTMPKMDHLGEAAKVVAWHKQPGDKVAKGEILLEIETDKSVLEVESTVSGVLSKIVVQAGETVPVGASLALVEEN